MSVIFIFLFMRPSLGPEAHCCGGSALSGPFNCSSLVNQTVALCELVRFLKMVWDPPIYGRFHLSKNQMGQSQSFYQSGAGFAQGLIFILKCLKATISLLFILLSCALTLFKMFSTIFKFREICTFIQGKVAFLFFSPAANICGNGNQRVQKAVGKRD